MIPIKGYATFDPLKHCWLGSGFKAEWFDELFKNDKIASPLKRIADETEEDYQTLEKILQDAGVKTYRSFLDRDKYQSFEHIDRPPTCPRDHFAVVGETFHSVGKLPIGFDNVLDQIDKSKCMFDPKPDYSQNVATSHICRVGKDIWWDIRRNETWPQIVRKYKQHWEQQGFRVHVSHRGGHSDSTFCVVKPGLVVTLENVQNYDIEFPGWDILYLPDQSWEKVKDWSAIQNKVGGRWWLKGEEHNDELIHFVNNWLDDWVGYVEETVFDVNMLSIDQNTIICNNYNKEMFDLFKKHKVEPIIFNFRHRYFWDGGVHCITNDLYREGTMTDYFS